VIRYYIVQANISTCLPACLKSASNWKETELRSSSETKICVILPIKLRRHTSCLPRQAFQGMSFFTLLTYVHRSILYALQSFCHTI
jgi:hypothetical protein